MHLIEQDKNIPEVIARFLKLIQVPDSPLEEQHFLMPFIEKYEIWDKRVDLKVVPTEILQLATISKNVLLFKNDWANPTIKKWMIGRIRNSDQSKGILFEFRAATHYKIEHRSVNWIANNSGREEPDIRVETKSGHIVYVECTRKLENPERANSTAQLVKDILKTLRSKMNQRQNMKRPLHLAIYIPEEYQWRHDALNLELSDKIISRFTNEQHGVITAVTIVSSELPKIRRDNYGRPYYDSSLPVITFRNENATYPFPDDFFYSA